jgi:hypothetical protein
MKKHYETHVEDTDKLISVAGPVLDYKSWYEQYRKLMEEQAQRKYGLYTPTSEGDGDDFPSIPGIVARYSALGLTNEQMAENPVWKDLTGNGHDLRMKNFAWSGMSGVGGYGDENHLTFYNFTLDDYNFVAIKTGAKHMNFTFRVTGLQPGNKLTLAFFGTTATVYGTWDKDGIYTVNSAVVEVGKPVYFYNGYGATRGEFTIEILPLYPGALVFDGVDDYGVCENFPILTKEKGYTVVALRQWITRGEIAQGLVSNVKNWLKDGAFLLEYRNIQAEHLNKPISFGAIGSEMDLPHILTYQTSKSYNGVSITTGNFEGTDVLHVGKLAPTNVGTCINAAIWELVFLDHDATEEELTKIKDYFVKTYPWLFPDQAWTVTGKTNEDEDRATIANITGNGNNLVLSNFGFAEGSGYGLYGENYAGGRWVKSTNRADLTWTSYSVNITSVKVASTQLYYQSYPEQPSFTIPSYKIKVYGLKDGQTLSYKQVTSEGQQIYKISKDGIYTLPSFLFKANGDWYGFTLGKIQETCDITIEQIPEYEGYLITDGVDDKAISKQFKFGENFTVILDFKFPVKKISYCGFDLSSKVRIQNLQGSGVYVVLKGNKTLIPSNVVRAVTSEGKVYDENWNEYNIVPGNISSNYTMVNLGFDGSNQFAESATKLAGIYSSTLSKDDCIKAYNYLQTLKSK